MNWIILDLEATCWQDRRTGPNEIIEIGALCINDKQEILGEFQSFVKPQAHPKLSKFCTELTSITQKMVDSAPLFPEALDYFLQWIQSFKDDYMLCSWGNYDRNQFLSDCQLHNTNFAWLRPHISLKHQHAEICKLRRKVGVKNALKLEGLDFEGTHHRGIDDARNIAKIFLRYYGQWRPVCVLL